MLQKCIFYVLFPISKWKEKKQTWWPKKMTQMEQAMKKVVLKLGGAWLKPGDFT